MIEYITSEKVTNLMANLPQLVFEVTDACNLKCKYCAYGELYNDYDKRENKKLSIKQAIRLIDYLVPLWNSNRNTSAKSHIRISFYGGEPLLNFHFIENIVTYITKEIDCPNHIFTFSMTTNAVLLHKYIDYLADNKFHLLISLDGNKENNSYRLDKRGENSFERIVNNIGMIKEKYPDYFRKYVNFNAVLHNKNSVEQIHDFFKRMYNKTPRIGELNTIGIRKDKINTFNQMYQNAQSSLSESKKSEEIENEMFLNSNNYKKLALFLYQYSGFIYEDYLDLLYDKEEIKSIPTGTCLPFSKKMFVTVNGKILACERIGHQFGLGQVSEEHIELNSADIANKYNYYYNKMSMQCDACQNNKACIQCLFNIQGIETKPICYGYMNERKFQSFCKEQIEFLRRHPEAYKKIMEEVLIL